MKYVSLILTIAVAYLLYRNLTQSPKRPELTNERLNNNFVENLSPPIAYFGPHSSAYQSNNPLSGMRIQRQNVQPLGMPFWVN